MVAQRELLMGQCYLFHREKGDEASTELSSCHTQTHRDRLNLPQMGPLPAQVWWPPEKGGISRMGIGGGPEAWPGVSLEGRVRRQEHSCVLPGDISPCDPVSK